MKNSFQTLFTRASFAGLILTASATSAFAQTNGTLIGTTTAYNYSTAPWLITSGPGTYPDGGGVATFGPVTGTTPGTVGAAPTVTLDVSPTLSQIVINTPIQYILGPGTGTSLIAASTGLTINAQSTAQNVSTGPFPLSIAFGSQITAPISGGGTAGLTKTGSGNFYMSGANTYTGGTHFNGGFFTIGGTAAVGDSVFGATGVGNGLSFNGGSVLFNTTGGLTTTRDIFLDTGGATITNLTATTLGGVISGTGSLTNVAFGAVALSLTGANIYTGATVATGGSVITTLSGAGSIATSSSYDLMGTFNLSNTATNVTNRLSDTAAMTVRGLNFISTGNATATSSETIGAVTLANSFNTFLVTPGATAANSLTLASLTRTNNSTVDFRGTGLGGTPGNTVSNIYATTAPTLTGGGGGAGSTVISILPYAIGNSGTTTTFTAAGQIGSSFVTYDVNGFRPLATAEYATAFGGSNLDNVRITAATAVPGTGVTANSVLLAPATAAASALSGGPINITSGAFLYSPTANVTGTVSAALNFGAAEGLITNTSLLTMSGVLSGSGGLTLTAAYAPSTNYTPNLSLTGANTYTGNTTINSGTVGFSGTVATGTASAFGTSGTVILNGGVILASLAPTASTTFNRDISSIGNGQNYISPSGSGYTSTFNGNINLANNLNLEGFTNAAASALNFNGTISGTGALVDVAYTYAVLSGNNTYSGGTILSGTTAGNASTYYAGTDTAFGTGTITFNGTSALAGVGTTARTLANDLFLNATSTFTGTAPLTFTGNVNLNGARTLGITNTALTAFSGVVASGAVTKTGTGAVAFNSPTGNTYTGGTVLGANVGALLVNNTSGSGTGTGAVSIGGTSQTTFSALAGNFTISGAVSIGGRLSPGNVGLTAATAGIGAIGTANFGSTLTLSSTTASSLYLEIASNTSHDQINVGGALTLAGTVYFATTGGYVVQAGDTFDFVDSASTVVTGTLAFNSTGVTFAPGVVFDTTQFAASGVVTAIAVPEPGTWALLGLGGGLLALGAVRARRQVA